MKISGCVFAILALHFAILCARHSAAGSTVVWCVFFSGHTFLVCQEQMYFILDCILVENIKISEHTSKAVLALLYYNVEINVGLKKQRHESYHSFCT